MRRSTQSVVLATGRGNVKPGKEHHSAGRLSAFKALLSTSGLGTGLFNHWAGVIIEPPSAL